MGTPYKFKFLAFLYIFQCFQIQNNQAQTIFVYSDHHKQGDKLEISIAQCSNFPEGMVRQLTSIDTRDQCARFFDAKNCSGASIEILPHSPSHHNLHSWGFNDRAVSVGPCRDHCSTEVTGILPEEPLEIQIFSRPNFKGAYESLHVNGCTLIPTHLIHTTLSVKPNGNCVQLYNNINCKSNGQNVKSIELRFGTPFHDDISKWWFPEARAVSHCSHKCGNESSQTPSNKVSPGKEEVILFDEKHFEGNWHKIRLPNMACVNIAKEWEGTAMSVRIGDKGCVKLYDRRNCTGETYVVTASQSDLSERKFDAITRSVQSCGPFLSGIMPRLPQNGHNSIAKDKAHMNASSSKRRETSNADHYTMSPLILTMVIVAPLLGIIISAFLVFFIMRRCHPYKNIMEMLSEKEIQEFLSGLGMDIDKTKSVHEDGADYSVELLAQNKPYNEAYEIPRSRIKYDAKVPLGVGEFGVVYKGTVIVKEENSENVTTIPVAVKTVKPSSGVQCLRSLLKEVKVMLYVGKHPHIAHLIGCCTENLRKGEILVLVEFCSKGSMENFLQKNRQNFKNIVSKGRIEMQETQHSSITINYQNLENSGSQMSFDFYQLFRWCLEIARGMEFLSSSKVVHSDLAARNVLLTENFQAKISDFGLSRQLYCYTQYVKKHQEPLPWRWLAIESLKNLEFSSKSDVWSYGILCWEIFTLGEKPYPGVVWSKDFISNLEDGLRLTKPKYTTTECYNIMIRCWNEDPLQRPTFSEIIEELQESLVSNNYCNDVVHDFVHQNNSYDNLATQQSQSSTAQLLA